jgi:hypothetical protein
LAPPPSAPCIDDHSLIVATSSNLEKPAMSSSNLFSIDLVCQLEIGEEGVPSKFKKENHPFEQRIVLNKTSCIENTKSCCIIS